MKFTGRRKKKQKKVVPQQTMIGKIIDLPMKEFEEELIKQRVNIGTMKNLILNLESVYFELRNRKDAILKMNFETTISKAEAKDALNGLYAEMIKVEEKITYLKRKVTELVDVG